MSESKETYFSMVEVANRYGVDSSSVSRWIKDGFFPGAIKKGPYKNSPYVIPQTAIDHFDAIREGKLPS